MMVWVVDMFVLYKVAHLCVVESFGDADEGWEGWDCGDGATPMFFSPRLTESDALLYFFVFFFLMMAILVVR